MTKPCTEAPFCAKKIARESAIWAGLRKSRVTKISQNRTNCLFLQAFHDILIHGKKVKGFSGTVSQLETRGGA